MIYVNAVSLNKPEVKAFAVYYMTNDSKLVKKVKGTSFGGENQIGLKIEDVMNRQIKL